MRSNPFGPRLALLLAALPMAYPAVLSGQASPQPVRPSAVPASAAKPVAGYGQLPLSFVANQSESADGAKFTARGEGYSLSLTDQGAVLRLSRRDGSQSAQTGQKKLVTDVVTLDLAGANPARSVAAQDKLPGTVNFFIGNDPSKWRTAVPTYARVRYSNVYDGIDLVYYGNQRHLEYDFVVAAGADPKPIRLKFNGAEQVRIDASGDLEISNVHGAMEFLKPVVYQQIGNQRRTVAGAFELMAGNTVGFKLGKYSRSQPLVIDPVLAYSTYLGGTNGGDEAFALAVDSSGDVYVTGAADSTDFPTTQGTIETTNTTGQITFVTKFNANGTKVIYSTFFGGGGDSGYGIAVDSTGNAYVAGTTYSGAFPVSPSGFQQKKGGNPHTGYVAKLNATGTKLLYATYLGGSGGDDIAGIAIDSAGDAYVIGSTGSQDFPLMNPYISTNTPASKSLGTDGFVTKLNSTGSELIYSTYLGGTNPSSPFAIAVSSAGVAYIAGQTYATDFPVSTGAFQFADHSNPSYGNHSGFITALNAKGSAPVYSTFLGGTGSDLCSAIAIDAAGNAYVTGTTGSSDFPVSPGAFQTTFAGNYVAYVFKLNSTGTKRVYGTYLSGTATLGASSPGTGIAVNGLGEAYVIGNTPSTNFPTTANAYETVAPTGQNVFVTKLNSTGTEELYSSYYGGSYEDAGNGIVIDAKGDAYFAGFTYSSDLPGTTSGYQPTNHGGTNAYPNAFAAKFTIGGETITSLKESASSVVTGVSVTFTATPVAEYSNQIPTGNVVFTVDGTAEAPVALVAGVATYSTSFAAAGTHTVVAGYAGTANFVASISSTVSVNVTLPIAAAPVYSPAAGQFPVTQTVTLSTSTPGATIYYSLTGAATTASTVYTKPIVLAPKVKTTYNFSAITAAPGYQNSGQSTASYTIVVQQTPEPKISLGSNTYSSVQTATITDSDAAAVIYYTTNGATPSATSTQYTLGTPILITASETLKAIALDPSFAPSTVDIAIYTIIGSPTALAYPATAVSTPDATLNAIVNTEGLAGSYYFQYGTSATALTSTTTKTALTASTTPIEVSSNLTTLASKTTYYFQVVVSTAGGASTGKVLSFTTN